jgi:Rod binding domain-containing protein
MSLDFSLTSLTSLPPLDLSPVATAGATESERIKQVSKAMESVFTSQLMAEMGKGIDGSDDDKEGGDYQDFIQQAMTQGVSQGGGFGLAKMIENYLTHRNQTPASAHPTLTTPKTSYHVQPAD